MISYHSRQYSNKTLMVLPKIVLPFLGQGLNSHKKSALKTLVAANIVKHHLITSPSSNEVIRLKCGGDYFSTKVKKTKIRFQAAIPLRPPLSASSRPAGG